MHWDRSLSQSDYGISPEQYHHQLDKLWAALGYDSTVKTIPNKTIIENVFSLAVDKIKELEKRVEELENCLLEKGEQ